MIDLVFSLLLQLGVDINAKDNDGWTPLHAAVHWGQNDACEVLADHGANFSARNKMVTALSHMNPLDCTQNDVKLTKVSDSCSKRLQRRVVAVAMIVGIRKL